MVVRDLYGGTPLLLPRYGSPEVSCSGTAFADAMRASYRYAQTQGRMIGTQVHRELYLDEDQVRRSIYTDDWGSADDWSSIARCIKRLPAHARLVLAHVSYQVFLVEETSCKVHHRITVSDGTDSDTGLTDVQEQTAIPFSLALTAETVIDLRYPDSTLSGRFSVYDLPFYSADCLVEIDDVDLSDPDNRIVVTVEAVATRTELKSAVSDDSSRTSNVVRLDDLASGHNFQVGDLIWTTDFDENVPESSPVPVTARDTHWIEYTLEGADAGDFGDGTVYRAVGLPVYYRPGVISVWWEP